MRRTVLFCLAILVMVTANFVLLALPQAFAVRRQNPGIACRVTGTNPGGHTMTLTFRGPNASETAAHVQNGWLKAHFTGITNSCA